MTAFVLTAFIALLIRVYEKVLIDSTSFGTLPVRTKAVC